MVVLGWALAALAPAARAGGGPCNYLVLYDQTDPDSIAVANYYQQVRGIPERNMVPYTFFPPGRTTFVYTNLWDLTLHLRQVIQNRGLAGRFSGIAVAGSVPLMGKSFEFCFQSGLYFSPGFTSWNALTNSSHMNRAFALPPEQPTREIRDDQPFVTVIGETAVTNSYWPISFVGFTGVNGNTPDEVFALLDRSKAADGQRPDGVIYMPFHDDIRYYTRESQIAQVTPLWDERGIRYLRTAPAVGDAGRPDIAGQFVGMAQADAGVSGNTYLPGTWADHLTSNGGNLNTLINGQSSAAAWLRAGAYGASGTASEPYAIADKFPHAHIHTHLRAGATMAEAYWQAVQTPYEIMMLGDPLVQAWAHVPQVTISSPAEDATLSGVAAINTSASTASPDGLETPYELAMDGRIVRIGATNETVGATWTGSGFTLDTTTLADGWHELRVLACNSNAVHTLGEERRAVIVSNTGQSVSLTGPSAIEVGSNGTFTVSLTGIANATNVTLQANGRTFATLPPGGGSTNLASALFGFKGTTRLHALAWLNNGRQVWSAPLPVGITWTPAPATNVTPGAAIARIRYFSDTTAPGFDWDSSTPDVVTNLTGPVLAEGFKTAIKYRAYSVDTNFLAPANYATKPGFDSTMYFLAPADGLYEFMVDNTSISNILMDIDGRRIQHGISTSEGPVKPAPVKLAAGFHHVRLRFWASKSDYQAEFWYRGGISPGNINALYYSNILVSRMNEFVCFGPPVEGNAPPVITNGPAVLASSTSTRRVLSVGAADPDSGPESLTYSWAKIDGPGQMTVVTNAASGSFTNLATFNVAGNYRLRVIVSDGASVATGEVTAAIDPVFGKVVVSPSNLTMRAGTSVQLYALQLDQFSTAYTNRPFVWSLQGGGTLTSNGFYTAPVSTGTNRITVSIGGSNAVSTITVVDNFPPSIEYTMLDQYGDAILCMANATDDLGTNNLTYTWEPDGAQPGTITFASNGTATNPAVGHFTRFGTYNLRVGVTDGNGATVWASNSIAVGPSIESVTVDDSAGNGDGRLDPGESADLRLSLYRLYDYGTNIAMHGVLSVTNTPGLSVVQGNSPFSTNASVVGTSSNLAPFQIAADSSLIDGKTRDLVLTATIGGASGELPFSLRSADPYSVTPATGSTIVPGTNDVGVHVRYFGGTNVFLPFAYNFGGQLFTSVFVNANGLLQFEGQDIYVYYGPLPQPEWGSFIAVHWDLLSLNGAGDGIFTSVSGTAPNRIFNIEWRAVRYFNTSHVIRCEARLFEAEPRVDLIYGTVDNQGAEAIVGLQVNPESYMVYSDFQPLLTNGLQLTFRLKSDTGAPMAFFSASPLSGLAPLPVSFTDTSIGGITNRFWNFGDGSTTSTTATALQHTYVSTGTYTVTLIVSGAEGASTNTQTDLVVANAPTPPAAFFNASPTSGPAPLAVSFTDTSTGDITNRYWNFGDGATTNVNATALSHTYASAGSYTVELVVSGPAGVSTNRRANLIQAMATLFTNMVGNAADNYIGLNTNGTPILGTVSSLTLAIADDNAASNRSNQCSVIVFALPALQPGQTVIGANLALEMYAGYIGGGADPLPKGVDIYGLRYATNSLVRTNDYGFKTLVGPADVLLQNNIALFASNIIYNYAVYNTDATGDAALAAWLNNQYVAGAVGGNYVFLRIHPDSHSANPIYITSANTVTNIPPTLTLEVGNASPPDGDTDDDGLPDEWETQYYGGPTNAVPSALASNGVNTVGEAYVAGLNPTDPSAVFKVAGQRLNGQMVIQWSPVSGRLYGVHGSTNLPAGFLPLATNLPWPQDRWTDEVQGVKGGHFRLDVRIAE
jgi:uncharacterized protein (TIGR03790 family)